MIAETILHRIPHTGNFPMGGGHALYNIHAGNLVLYGLYMGLVPDLPECQIAPGLLKQKYLDVVVLIKAARSHGNILVHFLTETAIKGAAVLLHRTHFLGWRFIGKQSPVHTNLGQNEERELDRFEQAETSTREQHPLQE